MNYVLIAAVIIVLLILVYYFKKEGLEGNDMVSVPAAASPVPLVATNGAAATNGNGHAQLQQLVPPLDPSELGGETTLSQIQQFEQVGRMGPLAVYAAYNSLPAQTSGGVAYGVPGASMQGMQQDDLAYYGQMQGDLLMSGQLREPTVEIGMDEIAPSLPASTPPSSGVATKVE